MTDEKITWTAIVNEDDDNDDDDDTSPRGPPAQRTDDVDANERNHLPFAAGLVGIHPNMVASDRPAYPHVSSSTHSVASYSSLATTATTTTASLVLPDSAAPYHHNVSPHASDVSQVPLQWPVQNYYQQQQQQQQQHQQYYLHPHLPPHAGTSSSAYQYIPHGSSRRRISYDEARIITRDGHSIPATPSSLIANRASTQGGHARNPNMLLSRRSSVDPLILSRRQQQQQPRQAIASSSSSYVKRSFDRASSSHFPPTTTINQTSVRRQQEIIITPHDFATSVSLTQQQLVLETDTTSGSNASASETPPTVVTTTVPEITNNPLRNHEDELQFLRDQWTTVCIALSSLRNMYVAVSASTATAPSSSSSSSIPANSTGETSLSSRAATAAAVVVDGLSSRSSSSSTVPTSTRRNIVDFPIPPSIAVTSFIGRAPLPRQNSQKTRGERSKGRGKGRANQQQQQQQGDPPSTGGGGELPSDIEHELLAGYDDAMLQLRQLQFRVEALEAEIHRLRTGNTERSRTTLTPPPPPPPPTE